MKRGLLAILLLTPVFGLTQTNVAYRQTLIAKALHSSVIGEIPTNTFAFQEYALDTLIKQAKVINEKWHIEIPASADRATNLLTIPTIEGMEGGVTIDNRYRLGIRSGRFIYFNDQLYSDYSTPPNYLMSNLPPAEMVRQMREDVDRSIQASLLQAQKTNLLTKEKALQVAREALKQIGIEEKNFPSAMTGALNRKELPVAEVTQSSFPDRTGKLHWLPHYTIRWTYPGASVGPATMEVSGVTKKVTHYESDAAPVTIPIPTNYYQMLNIIPNEFKWQYGGDPLYTEAFHDFAKRAAVRQMNILKDAWDVDFPEKFNTNHIAHFFAKPRTNGFSYNLQAANRFYFQGSEKGIDWFDDYENNLKMVPDTAAEVAALMRKNKLNKEQALKIARNALSKLRLDEKKLNLPQPKVMPGQFPLSGSEKLYTFPFYEVSWTRPDGSTPIGMVVSGITGKVVFYVNSLETGPKFSLPTNYSTILGIQNIPPEKKD